MSEPAVSSTHPRTTPAERAQWARRFYQSGLTQRAFALEHRLKLSTLEGWLAQNRPGAGRVPSNSLSRTPPSFTEVKGLGTSRSWAAEVVTEKGRVLRLAHDVPGGLLQELLSLC
jgi:hypothetical protein